MSLPEMAGALTVTRFQRRRRKDAKGRRRGIYRGGRPQQRLSLTAAGKRLLCTLQIEQDAIQEAKRIKDAARAKRRARIDAKRAAAEARAKEIRDAVASVRAAQSSQQLPETPPQAYPFAKARPGIVPGPVTPFPVAPAIEDGSDWQRYVSVPTRPAGFEPTAQTPGIDRSNAATLARIKAAGFRTNDRGEVLFAGAWISASEWMRRNGNVLD